MRGGGVMLLVGSALTAFLAGLFGVVAGETIFRRRSNGALITR